ncbi:MAG TPA: class I SAM-dependent methyltransferase [Candidatus Acidoferrum sp.]|nr:class I SAM-dependent methyltransferase [Candidatus Acidoferrum sp.]
MADWSQTLPERAAVLDLGCGTGVPISQALIERGFNVYGVDASPSMVAAFRAGFPTVPIECAAVDDSDFFGRTFDGVVAWGLFFLLDIEVQRRLIAKVAAVLSGGGRLLFTAPSQSCSWADAMTGRTSISLGQEAYRNVLEAEGMSLVGTHRDEGENHCYFAKKTQVARIFGSGQGRQVRNYLPGGSTKKLGAGNEDWISLNNENQKFGWLQGLRKLLKAR